MTDRGEVIAELRPPEAALANEGRPGERYQRPLDAGIIRPAQSADDPLADWPAIKLPKGTVAALLRES